MRELESIRDMVGAYEALSGVNVTLRTLYSAEYPCIRKFEFVIDIGNESHAAYLVEDHRICNLELLAMNDAVKDAVGIDWEYWEFAGIGLDGKIIHGIVNVEMTEGEN